ncbi:MAG: DNA-directed RNA polymerase subunit D [Candidatus ainarchaeum sp.]|nr:DNA-directed RNA polymerase subunit D [Candidatus ainarchaeum sp.]
MQLEVSKSTDKELSFAASGVSVALMNALRRLGMSSIPVFGIDKVTFYENDTSLFDEYVANRIGLVPIKTPEGYKAGESILFSLDKSTPGTVNSKALKSSDAKVAVANNDIPIIKLSEGQQLRLEAQARLGTAKEHARFQPGLIAYGKEGDGFAVTVESFGQMKAKEMVVRAAEMIGEKLGELKEAVKKEKE